MAEEEVTYADLKFQDSSQRKNKEEFEKFEIKAHPAPSDAWRHRILIILCLLLLLGLGVLGGMFYVTFKMQAEKIKKLQKVKDELQRNVSLQMMDNMNSSAAIRNLSLTLQHMATKLCRELNSNKKEHKCQPCPEKWMWHDDKCYLISYNYKSWLESEMDCSSQNATLLTVKSESVLKFIQSQDILQQFWLRLHLPRDEAKRFKNTPLRNLINFVWFDNDIHNLQDQMCGYSSKYYLNFKACTSVEYFICEKMSNPVKTESILMNAAAGRGR